MMIIFRKIKVIMVTVLGILMLLIGILLTVFISQNPQAKRQHAIGLGNIVIDYTSPMWKLDPTAIGMDLSGYGYPNVFAHDLDAANMVKHFNKDTNSYVRYWIVGNEPDQAGISAATYSANFNQDFAAMKAIDPTIKIGGGATAFYVVHDNPKNIVVINKDPSITQTATVSLNGVTSGIIDVWRKDESVLFPNPPIKLGTLPMKNGTFTYQLAPFSVTAFVLNTAGSTSYSAVLGPTASNAEVYATGSLGSFSI
jgi:hypothetical protein